MHLLKYLIIPCLLIFYPKNILSQEDEAHYTPVNDKLVQQKIEQWQNAKFGLLMHWGIYSQWEIVESWSLCGEDEGWCKRTGKYANDYEVYKKAYRDLKSTFNPTKFDPEKWAGAASEAGMKYVVFTTKHHDGFCMFDTKTTDYKITSKDCPFSSNQKSDITKQIFNAFRERGMMVGSYFSKPDWNCDYYWWSYFSTPDRHVNYDPAKYPERWKKFQDFTFTQIEELMTNYGPIDILWLDGAWVRPLDNTPKEFESWAKKNNYNQDIDIPRIAKMARQHQPGLIIVDRWVNGQFENYLTPENKVPEKTINVAWESCIPMATSWSYVSTDQYKSVRELVHILVDVVAKGGNLLLNIAPSPDGEWDSDAYERLKGIGDWMKINAEAIYGTRPISPYKEGNICFTKKDHILYAVYLGGEKEVKLPMEISISSVPYERVLGIQMVGTKTDLRWVKEVGGINVLIPESIRNNPPSKYAWVLKILIEE